MITTIIGVIVHRFIEVWVSETKGNISDNSTSKIKKIITNKK